MASAAAGRAAMLERLRDTIELLESIASDGSRLAGVPADERKRLLDAAGTVYSPDRAGRRRMAKPAARQRKAARVKQTEDMRARHVDGAARIVDPIISGFNTDRHVWRFFLKDQPRALPLISRQSAWLVGTASPGRAPRA